jgi:hypothetical protein
MTKTRKNLLKIESGRSFSNSILGWLDDFGFWTKNWPEGKKLLGINKDDFDPYAFFDSSEWMSKQLFNLSSEDIVWKSDYQLWNETHTQKISEKQFAEVCRWSDLIVEKAKKQGDHRPYMFIELLETDKYWLQIWQTTKILTDEWYLPAVFTSLTSTIGNEKAKNLIKTLLENWIIKKENPNLYVYSN